jgi:hypothetical protein
MFGGQGQLLAAAAQVEIGVAPTVQFTGTTEGLPGAAGMGVFAGMVNQEHGQVELALQLAQEGEQARDLGRIVFIDAMQPNEGIEDQQDRLEGLDRVGQALTGASKRRVGAVMTSTGKDSKQTCAVLS